MKKSIILFEDGKDADNYANILTKAFKKENVRTYHFQAKSKPTDKSFSTRLVEELKKAGHPLENVALFITDRELSRMQSFTGLAEPIISDLANQYAIPVCVYSQAQKNELLRMQSWSESKIILDISKGFPKIAEDVKIIYKGFEEIFSRCANIKKVLTPAELLANILGEPELKDRIALYGAGDQRMLGEILPMIAASNDPKVRQRHMSRMLGYWVWDSLIRFPGVLLNSSAASSYLNIAEDDFENKAAALFKKAAYTGPFSEICTLWWRHKIDAILFSEKLNKGLDYARKTMPKTKPAICCESGKTDGAGYYCMIRKKPVCAKHSRSSISWFPPGADLARISNSKYDELAPWLGLYN